MPRGMKDSLRYRLHSSVAHIYHRIRGGMQIVVLLASILYLGYNLRALSFEEVAIWRWPYFAFAWSLTFIATWMGAVGWWLVLQTICIPSVPSFRSTSAIHLKANLAKYLPGYGWQLAGKAYLAHRHGIESRQVGAAMLLELVTVLGVGAVFAATISLFISLPLPPLLVIFIQIIGGTAGIVLLALPFVWSYGAKRFHTPVVLDRYFYVLTVGAMGTGWISLGVGLWALVAVLRPIDWMSLPYFLFTIAGGILVGLAALFVPAGLGVRESVIAFLLTPVLGPGEAVLVATLSRVVLVTGELTAVACLLPWQKRES